MTITYSIRWMAKMSFGMLLAVILLGISKSVFAQEYTAADSNNFRKSLFKSSSDFDKIDYQLRLAEYSIRKPGSFKSDLDNARQLIEAAKKDNKRLKSPEAEAHILFEECYLSQEYGLSPEGEQKCEKAIELLKKGNNKYLLGCAYQALANYYNEGVHTEWQTKISLTRQAIEAYKKSGNLMKTAAALQYLGDLYTFLPDYPNALKALNESLAIYNAIHYPKVQGIYDLLGSIYEFQDDLSTGLKYRFIALKISDQLRDSTMQACEIYNHVGLALMTLHQPKNAFSYFKRAQSIAERQNDLNATMIVSHNLADCYNVLNKPQEALKALDEFTKRFKTEKLPNGLAISLNGIYVVTLANLHQKSRAQQYVNNLLAASKSKQLINQSRYGIYNALIHYYSINKDYNNELVFLKKDQEILNQWNVAPRKADNLQSWYKMDSARNDFKSSFYHLLAYKRLTDSIFNEKKTHQIGQLQIQFETQKKDDSIKLLTQQDKLDKTQLERAKLIRNVTIGGILVFIFAGVIFYLRYREKQRINGVITDQNIELQNLIKEKEWLLKEVHHRVKNNLHTVICLLDSQALYLQDDALKAIENSKHRIYAMSLIHQKLYQSEDIKVIDMDKYLSEFLHYLEESFGSPENIKMLFNTQPFQLAAAQAIPVGLIINEAVTNAYKYAFPNGKEGVIRVILKLNNDEVFLSVSDNGIGFQQAPDDEVNSLGMELIKGLAQDLRAKLDFESEKGTVLELRFIIDRFTIPSEEEFRYLLNAV